VERTIHDNLLLRYSVDRVARTIRLETEHRASTPRELTDILFHGVVAYYFANDAFELGTI
jgi:hypothetical protein